MAAPPPPPRIRRKRGGMLSVASGLLTLFVAIAIALVFGFSMVEREVTAKRTLGGRQGRGHSSQHGHGRDRGDSSARGHHRPSPCCSRPMRCSTASAALSGQASSSSRPEPASRRDRHPRRRARRSCTRSRFPEGLTSEQIVARLYENEILDRRSGRDAAGGHAAARHLQIRARNDASADHQRHAGGASPASGPDLAAPLPRSAGQDAAGTRHPRLDRREGNRPGRRAQPGRRVSSSTGS